MQTAGKKILSIASYIILLLMSLILFTGLFIKPIYICALDKPDFISNKWHDYAMMLIYAIILFILFRKRKIFNKIPFQITVILYFLLGLFYIYEFPLMAFSDMGQIYEAALQVAHGDFLSFQSNPYFATYPNNVVLALLYGGILWIFPETVVTLKVVNIILLISIIVIAEQMVQIYFPNQYRNLFYIFAFSFLPAFLYINHVYSDIPFTFLTVLAMYLYLKNNKNLPISCIIMGITYQLRPQSIFYIFAMFFHSIFFTAKEKRKTNISIIACITGLLVIVIFSAGIKKIITSNDQNLPVWSYVYMAFNKEEFGFQDGSHSPERTLQDVENRISELGVQGTFEIIVKKCFWMWDEGTFQAARYAFGAETNDVLSKFEYETPIEKYILTSTQKARKLLDEFMRGQYIILLLVTLLMFTKKYYERFSLFVMLFAANFLFYIFWEIKSRYIFPLYPIILIFVFIAIFEIMVASPKSANACNTLPEINQSM